MNSAVIIVDKPKMKKRKLGTTPYAEAHLSHLSMDDANVLKNVKKLKTEMDCVYDQLNFVTDETLIDSYIYEVKSIHLRYKYYIDLCKERGLAVEFF